MTAKVSMQDVERVAELAHLELAADESTRMVKDLNAILDYVAELNEIDTAGVAPLAQVGELLVGELPGELLGGAGGGNAGRTRPDCVESSLDRAVVMAQAPETDGAFFKVPKVIER